MIREMGHLSVSGLAGLTWACLCVAILVGFDGTLNRVALILLALFIYASIMLWKAVCDRHVSPLAILFWLFHANFLFLPAFSQSVHRAFFWSSYDSYREEHLLLACVIIVVGLLAFAFGTARAQKKVDKLKRHPVGDSFLDRPLKATWRVQLFLLIVLAVLALIVMRLGVDFFVRVRQERIGLVETSTEVGLLMNLPRALAVGVLLFSTYFMVQRWRESRTTQFPMLMIFLAAIGINAIVNYPLSLARFWFFGLIISLIWIVTPLQSVRWRSAFVISVTTLQFTLFPWFSQITRGSGLLGLDMAAIRRYMHHGDFDGFQSIVNALIYVRESGFEFGRSLVSVALFFVPRSVWNKAEPLGSSAAEHMGYDFTNLSSPIYGEFYVDFGLLSLIFGMGILGYGLKMLDGHYDLMLRQNRFGAGVILTSVLAGYLTILLRGSLLGVISGIATLFGLLLIASWLASTARKPRLTIGWRSVQR